MKKLAFCLLIVSTLVSCNKLEDLESSPNELDGRWELQSALCFCFYPEDFDFGAHKIEFNNDEGLLIVENSTETFFISEAGSYNYQIENNKVVIKNTIEYTYELSGETLVMTFVDDPEIGDDEITLTYKKIN